MVMGRWRPWMVLSWLVAVGVLWACSVKKDKEITGLCQLTDCSKAQILPSDPSSTGYSIEPLFELETAGLDCNFGLTAAQWALLGEEGQIAARRRGIDPLTLKLKVLGPSEVATGASSGGGGDKKVPFSGILVNVETSGQGFNDAKTHPDVIKMRTKTEYARGIGTSPKYWCSDSCGVISVDYHLQCLPPGGAEKSVIMVSSGATAFATTISLKTANFAEEEDKDDSGSAWLRGLPFSPWGPPMYGHYVRLTVLSLVEHILWMGS